MAQRRRGKIFAAVMRRRNRTTAPRRAGVACELVHPGAPDVKHALLHQYLIEKLTAKPR